MEKYINHIQLLVDTHGITVEQRNTIRGRAFKKSRIIKIPAIKSRKTYALALHELGHILGKQPKLRLDRETQAWLWAKENAIEWAEVMDKYMVTCLRSYLNWCQRKKNAWIPPDDHPAWEMAKMKN